MGGPGWSEHLFGDGTLLKECGPEAFGHLSEVWYESRGQADQLLLSADDRGDDTFFVLEGRVRAATFTESGREVTFSDLGPGDCFGIFAAIDGAPRSTNVLAVTPCRIARLRGAQLRQLILSDPGFNMALIRYLVRMIRDLSMRVTEFSALTADQRLGRELVRLARRYRVKPDEARIENAPTQAELASMISSHREAVAREMARLQKLGLLRRDGRTLVVSSISRLERHTTAP